MNKFLASVMLRKEAAAGKKILSRALTKATTDPGARGIYGEKIIQLANARASSDYNHRLSQALIARGNKKMDRAYGLLSNPATSIEGAQKLLDAKKWISAHEGAVDRTSRISRAFDKFGKKLTDSAAKSSYAPVSYPGKLESFGLAAKYIK